MREKRNDTSVLTIMLRIINENIKTYKSRKNELNP